MRYILLLLFYCCLAVFANGQLVMNTQGITVYEHANYGGASKKLPVGQHRLSDFNDRVSSIKVPAGMVAYIYEHAATNAGYGIAVDLLEDCPDLSRYGFNDKVSFVTVFYAKKDNFTWARNAMVNGQFVSGHWERQRATPAPPNTVAVVSPPIPPPVGEGFRNWQWAEAGTVPNSVYEQAMQQNQGIVAINELYPDFAHIGNGTVSVEAINGRPTHRPIAEYKKAHTGFLSIYYRGALGPLDDDNDVILYINPNPGDKPFEDFLTTGKSAKKNVEAEIDVMDAFAGIIMSNGPKIFSQITGYGPFVHEKHDYWDTRYHDYIEIHPCENVWSSELNNGKMKYNIGVFSDNSGRFNKWRPNPLLALNAIAFEVVGGTPLVYTMNVPTSHNMVPYPLFNDNTLNHCLLDGADTLVVIREASSPNRFFSIDFAQVSKTRMADGRYLYKGFMKIHSAVKDGGHVLYSVQETRGGIKFKPCNIKVTLNSISCLGVDDGNDTEELYGVYGVSAVTGLQPVHANVYTPGTANGTIWKRDRHNTLNLKKNQTSVINTYRSYVLPASGELVLYGDIDEDDGGGDDDDKLGNRYLERYKVKDLQPGVPKVITHRHSSGGTIVEVKLTIERNDPIAPVVRPLHDVIRTN